MGIIEPEQHISKDEVKKLLLNSGAVQSILSIIPIIRGSTNVVYKIATNAGDFILKISHRPDRNQGKILEKEARVLKQTQNRSYNIPIPQIIWKGNTNQGWPAILETALEGERIEHLATQDVDSTQAAAQLGTFVALWHQNKHPIIEEFEQDRPTFANFQSYASFWLDEWQSLCEQAPHIPLADIRTAYQFIKNNLDLFLEQEYPYIHADISNQNLLGKIQDGKLVLTGLCDFENVQTGPLEYDIATIDDGIFLFHPDWEKPFLSGYQQVSKLPQNFKQRLKVVNLFRALRYIKRSVKYHETHYYDHDAKYFRRWL